jgi:nucleoside-specific outer membrane channel protein Tsx
VKKIALCLPFLALLPAPAMAETKPWIEWHSSNVQVLYGEGFEFSDNSQTTITLEHANGWRYGDNFIFMDYSIDEPDTINGEFSPRLSFGKITGADLSFGIVQDILLSGTWEKAKNFDVYLYGGAVDLNLPGFNFFQVNLYERDNPDFDGKGWQTTVVWNYPFQLGNYKMSFEGYFDYADYEEGTTNFFTQPQLLLDAGDALKILEPGKFYTGLEYRYWHNLYGIEGETEIAPQAVAKWIF